MRAGVVFAAPATLDHNEFGMALREEGISDFVYDEEEDLFRFPEDGRFAFSKEYANVKLLEERGYFGWALPIGGEYLSKRVARYIAYGTAGERVNRHCPGRIG